MKIKIEDTECECFDGETILDVARRNNIQIPTICFLSGCSPTLACKMCMVEVGGKRVYSCNAKVKDGMEVAIATDEILKDRKEIMTTYCVNHPLECGVCDKSGECELQDFTLHTKVDLQLFGLQEADKKSYTFAQSAYDPALCIMCERCVTTCKDNIGEGNLKAGKANLFTPDAHKESMGKDPYSVWAKRQKGLIEFVGKNECKDCGECISVCPVGAMTYKDFTYTSNAWELEKIHSTCGHCAAGCDLIYNVKFLDVKGDLQKVYRVQNDYLYNPICGAGRFAYDMVSVGTRNIESVLEAFRKADSINVGGALSNEEALIVNQIASALKLPLFNHEAKCYQVFQEAFLQARLGYASRFGTHYEVSGDNIAFSNFFATFQDFKTSNVFVSLNTYFKYDSPLVRYRINNNLKIQKSTQVLSFGLFGDALLESLGKNVTQINGEPNNIALAGLLGLVFANDLIDDFEECFPNTLQAFVMQNAQKTESYNIKDVQSDLSQQKQDDATDLKNNQESCVDNLSSYNVKFISDCLHLENLDSLKIAKPNGVLMVSSAVFEEFLAHDFTSIDGYGLQSHCTDSNPPSITNAVATAIMEGITQPLEKDLMDRELKLQILAHLLAFVCERLRLKLFYIPKDTNILGVANLCNLSWKNDVHEDGGYSIGIRTKGDFILDSNLDTIKPHFPLPTLAQSEGSLTTMENRVLVLNPSIPYVDCHLESGLDLADVAHKLGVLQGELENLEYMSDFTVFLHKCSAQVQYQPIAHKDLCATFSNDGVDGRGYFLDFIKSNEEFKLSFRFSLQLKNDAQFNALLLETQNQFNHTTQASKNLQSKSGIYASKSFMDQEGLKEGDMISLRSGDYRISAQIYCDYDVKDSLLLVSPLIEGIGTLFKGKFHANLIVEKMQVGNSQDERNRA